MENQLYGAEEVANYFRIGVDTVRIWVRRGDLQGFKAGRDWRFSRQQVEDCQRRLQERSYKRPVAV